MTQDEFEAERRIRRERDKRHLAGIVAWAAIGFFAVTGVDHMLGYELAVIAGFAWTFTLAFFARWAEDWF